jgi:hypothetical protein
MTRQRLISKRFYATLLLGGAVVAAASPALGQSRVVSIEEHWELQLAEPDADRSAPQTTMVMSPTGDVNGKHLLFTLNHLSAPDYQPGGMQVQLWDGEELIDQKVGHATAALDHAGETVSWTQRISLRNGRLYFRVYNGQSETWNVFGGRELAISSESSLASLNGYRPIVSLGESQVNYAENRVASLTLVKIVWTTDDGVVHEQDAPIPIDLSLDN